MHKILLSPGVVPVYMTFPLVKSMTLAVLLLEALANISPFGLHRTQRTFAIRVRNLIDQNVMEDQANKTKI